MARPPNGGLGPAVGSPPKSRRRRPSAPVASSKKSASSVTERLSANRYALARGPLGIVLATLILVETVLGYVVRSTQLGPSNSNFVIYAMVGLAFATLLGFFVVWIRFPGSLYPPSQFQDERVWLTAVMREDMLPSDPLPIPSLVQVTGASVTLATPKAQPPIKSNEPAQFSTQMTAELQGGFVTSTLIMELSKHLQGSSDWDFLKVDTGVGKTWLLSRLFIFISLYRATRGLPGVVFVQTDGQIERLLGIADPMKLCGVLATLYPWFNETFAGLLTERKIPIFMSAPIDEWTSIQLMTDFVHRLQSPDEHAIDVHWSKLSSALWEHSLWLNAEIVKQQLASACFDPKAAFLKRPTGMSEEDFAFEVMARDSPFVALVSEQGEFLQLYDKRRIFEHVRNRLRIV